MLAIVYVINIATEVVQATENTVSHIVHVGYLIALIVIHAEVAMEVVSYRVR